MIAHGLLLLVSKQTKNKLLEPFNFKSITTVVLAHNQSSIAAFKLNEAAEVTNGFSHVIIETQSLGLILRYIKLTNLQI